MAVYSRNEALMCKVFPSRLGPVAKRWFNGLKMNFIDSYRQLTQAFSSRFVTNRRAPRPLSALLSLSMHDGETLKAYLDRYWETYNEMEENFDNGLPADHGLRKSLTGKPATSMHQRIEEYKRVEEDHNCPKRDFAGQLGTTNAQTVNAIFREPVHLVLEKIKNEPYFRWPNKMVGEPSKCYQNLYCQYHQDHGYTTENCKNLWNHLNQLVREGRLKHLLHHSRGH
ncbi:uncharacterized protein LOC115961378 [Quercus lobata]|uniref:uncharacterized protein LOC115961378 n=1 Tax=Quercus lobata TaxID=97700 RepID=UPI001249001A|nr:uncharacterized protein LOC115961378 [Quercus lobata]